MPGSIAMAMLIRRGVTAADAEAARLAIEPNQNQGIVNEANKNRVNGVRLLSLKQPDGSAAEREVTIQSVVVYDSLGFVTGIRRITHPIEDVTLSSGPAPGLKSLLRDNRADINVDGDIEIDGETRRRRPDRP